MKKIQLRRSNLRNRSKSDPGGASWHCTHSVVEGVQGSLMEFSKCLQQNQQELFCVNHEWLCPGVLVETERGKLMFTEGQNYVGTTNWTYLKSNKSAKIFDSTCVCMNVIVGKPWMPHSTFPKSFGCFSSIRRYRAHRRRLEGDWANTFTRTHKIMTQDHGPVASRRSYATVFNRTLVKDQSDVKRSNNVHRKKPLCCF